MGRGSGIILALSLAATTAPRSTSACSQLGWVELVRPESGEVHPADAGMLFHLVADGSTEVFAVSVDGVPASLVIEAEALSKWGRFVVANIDPRPDPGQEVVVSICGAPNQAEHVSCPIESPFTPIAQFEVGAFDTTSPPAAGAVALAHELGAFDDGCGSAALRFDVELTALDQSGEVDVLYVAELQNAAGAPVGKQVAHVAQSATSLGMSFSLSTAVGNADEYCVSVHARDLSGNATFIDERCGSELIESETTDTGGSTTAADDDTSAGDGTPDATTTGLGAGDADTGGPMPGSDVVDRGCSCSAPADGSAPAGMVGLVVLIFYRRDRRARSHRRV